MKYGAIIDMSAEAISPDAESADRLEIAAALPDEPLTTFTGTGGRIPGTVVPVVPSAEAGGATATLSSPDPHAASVKTNVAAIDNDSSLRRRVGEVVGVMRF